MGDEVGDVGADGFMWFHPIHSHSEPISSYFKLTLCILASSSDES